LWASEPPALVINATQKYLGNARVEGNRVLKEFCIAINKMVIGIKCEQANVWVLAKTCTGISSIFKLRYIKVQTDDLNNRKSWQKISDFAKALLQ